MKQLFITCTILLLVATTKAQLSTHIKSVYNTIKQQSIHAKNANWTIIDKHFTEKLTNATTEADTLQSILYVFKQLNDYHSAIIYNGRYFTNYPSFSDSELAYLTPLVQLSNQRMGIFTTRILENKYLYIQVPTVQAMGNNVSVFAQMLSDSLSKYLSTNTKAVVIDLRLNGGGQFSSMAAGLAPFLGNVYIGGGINNELKQTIFFEVKEGNIFLNNNPTTHIKHKTKINAEKIPVAIIMGANTRSSGSILAISFKQRPNTIFIGEHTANGYTTGNDYLAFGNNLFLNLSTTNSIDRKNNVYTSVVEADIVIKGADDFNFIEKDIKVKEAIKWFKKNNW